MEEREGNGAGGAERRPLGVLVASAIAGVRALARAHVDLAKVELREAASVRAKGTGMIAAGAVVAMYAIGFLAAAGAAGLAVVLPVWAAILIVAVLLLGIAGVLMLVAKRTIRTAPPPGERTRETLREDARWARRQIER